MLTIHAASSCGLVPPPNPNVPTASRRSVLGAAAAFVTTQRAAAAPVSPAASASDADMLDASVPLSDTSQEYDASKMVLFDTRSGSFLPPVPERYLASALQKAADDAPEHTEPRVLFAAEDHTNPLHHRMQLDMIKAAHTMDAVPTAIGLEMFYRQHQPALDAFVFEDGSMSALKRRTHWRSTWGYDFNQYSKIFAYARRHGIRLVGLNVPFGLVNAVANVGLEGLPPQMAEYVPDIDLGQKRHFERFEREMRKLSGETQLAAPTLWRYYESTLVWDEYMAESIAGFVGKNDGRLVVLAGTQHVARDSVPDRVTRRTGGATFTTMPLPVPWSTNGMPAIAQPRGRETSDWLLYTQREISHEPRQIYPGGPRVLEQPPRVSPSALRLGTSAAPITEV